MDGWMDGWMNEWNIALTEFSRFLGYYAAYGGLKPTFRDYQTLSYSRARVYH
jgi:hypothetical protein